MTPSNEFKEFVLERLECTGKVNTSKFFGGVGLRRDGVQFGMMIGNSLYLVVDDITRPAYIDAGSGAFSYLTKKGRVQVRRYFEVPQAVLEDDDTLRDWTAQAVSIARR
jgi:DNA transformation protein and related proteins